MFEITRKESSVEIKYNTSHKKRVLSGMIGIVLVALVGSIIMLILHFANGISVAISAILAFAFVAGLIVCTVKYRDITSFYMLIDSQGIRFFTKKSEFIARWDEIKKCGILYRTGSESIDDVPFDGVYEYSNMKNTFYFSKSDAPNLKKLIYNIRTTALVDHGIYKDTCYISEKRGSGVFRVISELFEKYNQNPDLKLTKQDRTDA